MMTPDQFENYQKRLNLPEIGREYLSIARNGKDGQPASPARRVESRIGNYVVRYASGKNQKVLPLESRRLEFAAALLMENDNDYLEFLTQPPTIEMEYLSAKGRRVPCNSTFDFLALRSKEIQWIETKPADTMRQLVKDYPGRYQEIDENHWRSEPAENIAKSFGFTFRIWTDEDFTRERIRNLRYWDPFLKLGRSHFPETKWQPVQDFLSKHPGISLDELGEASGVEGQALVRWMLAHGLIFCDLDKFVLADSGRTRIYPSAAVAKAMEALRIPEPQWPSVVGNVMACPVPILDELATALMKHGKDSFAQANWRWRVIHNLVPRSEWDVTPRTVSNWRHANREGGYLALLSGRPRQGNRKPRRLPAHTELAKKVIDEHGMKPGRKKAGFFYSLFQSACVAAGLSVPSRIWFRNVLNSVPKEKLVEAQEGRRASLVYRFDLKSLQGLWDSRGDYPFMDVHCDHTELSVFCSSERTGQLLKKVWLTVLFDATCRAVLAFYLSYDRPGRDSLMMVLRDCIQRHGLWPFGMIVDHGAEFGSTYFETLTGKEGILVIKRPKGEPTYGNPIENFFGVTEGQFIQILEGCSLIFKTPRIATKAVDPRRNAPWTLSALSQALDHYFFKIFNEREHAELGKTPAQALKDLSAKHGIDQLPKVKFDNGLLIKTMPEVEGGTCHVFKRCCVKVRGDLYFNHRLAPHIGDDLPTRWDPSDPSRVLVQLPEGWIECHSKYVKEVQGLSARDVKFLAQELRARHAATVRNRAQSDIERGHFFRELKEQTEPALEKRRDQAAENHNLNGKLAKVSPATAAVPSVGTAEPKPAVPTRKPSPGPKPAIRIKARNFL